jgi:flagellar basal-body rod protein FlgB
MDVTGIFNNTFSLLERNLDLRIKKNQLVASNIANIDTPNYKAFDIDVQNAFSRINAKNNQVTINSSNLQHFQEKDRLFGMNNLQDKDDLIESYIKPDENNDIDKAMMNLAENSIVYNATVQILSKKYNLLKQTINER